MGHMTDQKLSKKFMVSYQVYLSTMILNPALLIKPSQFLLAFAIVLLLTQLVCPAGQDFRVNLKNESALLGQNKRRTSKGLNYRVTWPHFIPE